MPAPESAQYAETVAPEFVKELTSLLNRYSMENESNTPDFLLAEYLVGCLGLWQRTALLRDDWWGYRQGPTLIGDGPQ